MSAMASSFLAATLLSGLAAIWSSIPWSCIYLFTQCFGLRLYVARDRETCLRIQRRLKWTTHTTDGGKPCGYAIGKWYFLQLIISPSEGGDQFDVWILGTAASYEQLTKEGETGPEPPSGGATTSSAAPTPPPPQQQMTIYSRSGSYYTIWFRKRIVSLDAVVPRPGQEKLLVAIESHYRSHHHTVAYIYGPPGMGKSLLGPLLATRLKGSYCNTLKPWQPGDTLGELYNEAAPTAEAPLIVAFDEFDAPLLRIHSGIEPHKNLPTLVADKAGWNHFFDEIARGLYPNLIVLLTSNRDPEFVRSLDPSYIRDGRVNLIAELAA